MNRNWIRHEDLSRLDLLLPFLCLTGCSNHPNLIHWGNLIQAQLMHVNIANENNLATLALRVAHEVDRKLSGRIFNTTIFSAFRESLSKATGGEQPAATSFLYFDPLTTEVFAQAVVEASHQEISTVAELGAAIQKIIKSISVTDEASDNDFSLVKSFCLSLHRSIMSQMLPPLPETERQSEDELGFIR